MVVDDPMRVDAPLGWTDKQEQEYGRRVDELMQDIEIAIEAVHKGIIPHARIGPHLYDAGELGELIVFDDDPEFAFQLLFAGPLGEKMIRKFAERKAEQYVDTEGI